MWWVVLTTVALKKILKCPRRVGSYLSQLIFITNFMKTTTQTFKIIYYIKIRCIFPQHHSLSWPYIRQVEVARGFPCSCTCWRSLGGRGTLQDRNDPKYCIFAEFNWRCIHCNVRNNESERFTCVFRRSEGHNKSCYDSPGIQQPSNEQRLSSQPCNWSRCW